MGIDTKILLVAGRQHGLATRGQLVQLGLSPQQNDRRIRMGMLVVRHRGVYAVASARVTFEHRALAALLAAGPDAALSHRTAARLLDLRGTRNYRQIHLTVPEHRCLALPGATVHRSTTLHNIHDVIETRSGFRVTRPERTVIGSSAGVTLNVAKRVLDAAIGQGYTTTDRLWLYLTRYGGPGCNGAGVVRRILMERDPRSRPVDSTLESEWIEALESRGVTGWVPQWEVQTSDGVKRVDLAIPELRAGLEFDSRLWHTSEEDYRAERRKRYVLGLAGVLVLPVTEYDLHERVDEVAADVRGWATRLRDGRRIA